MDRSVKAYCNTQVTDEQLAGASVEFHNPPTTKEAYLYRTIFHKYYPQTNAAQTVRKWIPDGKMKIQWKG
jgi:asparagine synthase (glutamine-hydrolysing)